jgi:creatinine amidohydrolase
MSEVWMQHLTWEDIRDRIAGGGRTVIFPVGSTEQHGPHLPLGTDTMVAAALAEAAARATGVLVAPPLWFGWSPHHMVLPGTITIRPEILIELAYDMLESLQRHGLTRFIFVNGHRIVNLSWLQIAAERAKRQLGVKVVLFDPAYMSKSFVAEADWGEIGHAEEIEGSQMWHLHPDLVKMERAVDNPHQSHPLYHVDPSYPGDTLCYVPGSPAEQEIVARRAGGTGGSPRKGSREDGARYHAHLVKRLVEVVQMLQS